MEAVAHVNGSELAGIEENVLPLALALPNRHPFFPGCLFRIQLSLGDLLHLLRGDLWFPELDKRIQRIEKPKVNKSYPLDLKIEEAAFLQGAVASDTQKSGDVAIFLNVDRHQSVVCPEDVRDVENTLSDNRGSPALDIQNLSLELLDNGHIVLDDEVLHKDGFPGLLSDLAGVRLLPQLQIEGFEALTNCRPPGFW